MGSKWSDDIQISVGRTDQVLRESHLAVASSGTITLMAGYFGVPMVIFYRVGRIFSQMIRPLVRTQDFSLVNILGRRRIVPELIPWYGSARELTSMVLEVMDDLGYLLEVRKELIDLTDPLRVAPPRTASANAADLIADVLEQEAKKT